MAIDLNQYKLPTAGVIDLEKYKIATPTPPPTTSPPGFFKKLGTNIANVGIGALKGAGSTLHGLSKIVPGIASGITNTVGLGPIKDPLAGVTPALETKNTAQKVGFGGEQIAEFFAPEALGSKVAKIPGLVEKIVDYAPKLAEYVPKIPTAIKLATEGIGNVGLTKLQGGSNFDAGFAGLLPALLPALGKGLKSAGRGTIGAAFDLSKSQLEKGIEYTDKGWKDFATNYITNGKWFKSADTARETISKKILPDLGKFFETFKTGPLGKAEVTVGDIVPTLKDAVGILKNELGSSHPLVKELQAANKGLSNLGPETKMLFKDALELKQSIWNRLPKSAFGPSDSRIGAMSERLKGVANALKTKLEDVAEANGDKTFKQVNDMYGLYKNAYDNLVDKAAKKFKVGAPEYLSGAAGALLHNIQTLPYIAGAYLAEKAATTFPVEVAAGKALYKAGEKVAGPAGGAVVGGLSKAEQGVKNFLQGK